MVSKRSPVEIYNFNRKRKKVSSILLVLIISSLLLISAVPNEKNDTKIIINQLPFYGQVTDFTLTNSNYENYTFSADDGKIRVVNFFYTKCPDPDACPLVTLRLSQLFAKVRQNSYLDQVRFISIDFDYINDTVDDLADYAVKYTADTTNWQFVIGNSTEIDTVTDEWGFYFAVRNETGDLESGQGSANQNIEEPYDHSLIVYIVDQNSNIRKFLLGSSWDINNAFESIEFLIGLDN